MYMLWHVSTAYVPSPLISNFHNSSGRSGRVCFFSRTLAFVNINNQSLRKEVGWTGGVWLMGSKGSGKTSSSKFDIHWIDSWMDWNQAFPTKMFTKICPNHHFPNFFYLEFIFRKMPPGDSQVTDLWIFHLEVTNDAPLKWVTFSPQGRPPGEDFAPARWLPNVWRVRVPVRSPGLVTTSDQPNPPNRLGWEFIPNFGI